MLEDLKDAFTVTLKKRLASPFLSTFFLSWCVVNYDVFLLFISSADWNSKVIYIQNAFSTLNYRIEFPAYAAAFYVVIWPAIDMFFYRISKGWLIRSKKLQMKMENKIPLSEEDRETIRENYIVRIDSARTEIAEKESRISELEKRNKLQAEEHLVLQSQVLSEDAETRTKLLAEISELKEKLNEADVLNSSLVKEIDGNQQTELIVSENKNKKIPEYSCKYYISEELKKKESFKENFLELEQNIKFVRSDLDDNVFSKLHEIYYDGNVGRINIEPCLQVWSLNKFNQWYLQVWKLETSPRRLTHPDILNFWYKDYQASEIIMKKALEQKN